MSIKVHQHLIFARFGLLTYRKYRFGVQNEQESADSESKALVISYGSGVLQMGTPGELVLNIVINKEKP